MAVAIYMTRKDGARNLYEAGIDQVFVIPAGERFRGSIAGQGIEFLRRHLAGYRPSGLVFCGGTINYCYRNEYSPRARPLGRWFGEGHQGKVGGKSRRAHSGSWTAVP